MEMSLFQMLLFFLIVIFSRISLIASSIEQIQVRENVNVTITCQFETSKSLAPANPRSTFEPAFLSRSSEHIILWYKDETDVIGVNSISNDPKKYSIVQQNRHTYQLTIINAQLESSGVYKCQNFTAKEENRFQLNVIGKWEWSRELHSLLRSIEAQITFHPFEYTQPYAWCNREEVQVHWFLSSKNQGTHLSLEDTGVDDLFDK